jgi:hypothetical protein
VVISACLAVETVDIRLIVKIKMSRFSGVFMISYGSFENLCICVHKHSIVMETYCRIGCSLFRNRSARILKTYLKA